MSRKDLIHIWPAGSEPVCPHPGCGRLAVDSGEPQGGMRRTWGRRRMRCLDGHTWTIAWRAHTPAPDGGRAATGGRGPEDDGPNGGVVDLRRLAA